VPTTVANSFSGGPRICVGQQWALIELSYIVTRILQKFSRVELDGGMLDPPCEDAGKSLYYKNGEESLAWRRARQSRVSTIADGHSFEPCPAYQDEVFQGLGWHLYFAVGLCKSRVELVM